MTWPSRLVRGAGWRGLNIRIMEILAGWMQLFFKLLMEPGGNGPEFNYIRFEAMDLLVLVIYWKFLPVLSFNSQGRLLGSLVGKHCRLLQRSQLPLRFFHFFRNGFFSGTILRSNR